MHADCQSGINVNGTWTDSSCDVHGKLTTLKDNEEVDHDFEIHSPDLDGGDFLTYINQYEDREIDPMDEDEWKEDNWNEDFE